MMGQSVFCDTFGQLGYSVRTGSPAIRTVEPQGLWSHYESRPEEAQVFGQAMTAKAAADIASVLNAYDFERFGVVADVGAGRGHLLRAVLDATPNAKGVLFDLPEVIDLLDFTHDRIATQAGDFFTVALPAADAYLLMEVLHDWPTTKSSRSCKRSGRRLLRAEPCWSSRTCSPTRIPTPAATRSTSSCSRSPGEGNAPRPSWPPCSIRPDSTSRPSSKLTARYE